MKKKTYLILISGLIISQGSMALGQFCDNSVPNEWPDSRYFVEQVNGDHIVTDNKTGLMWQQYALGDTPALQVCESHSTLRFTWQEALECAQFINDNGGYAGYSDWRVPNIRELTTLVATNCYSPTANISVFPSFFGSEVFISSSPSPYEARYFPGNNYNNKAVWAVAFLHGEVFGSISQDQPSQVYLVRDSGY